MEMIKSKQILVSDLEKMKNIEGYTPLEVIGKNL